MYEAPDRYKRLTAARLPGGESLGLTNQVGDDNGSSPLRDIQLMSRGQLAVFFSAANIVSMLCVCAALWPNVSSLYLAPWAAAVIGGAVRSSSAG